LKNEFNGGDTGTTSNRTENKNPGNVAGGFKAALSNPNVSDEAKEHAKEKLDSMKE